jgi:hypothetical protein
MEIIDEPGPPDPWYHEPPSSQPTNVTITPSNPFDVYNAASSANTPLPFADNHYGPPSGSLSTSEAAIALELRQQVHHLSTLMDRLPEYLRTPIPQAVESHPGFPPFHSHTRHPPASAPPDLLDMPHPMNYGHSLSVLPIDATQPSRIGPAVKSRGPMTHGSHGLTSQNETKPMPMPLLAC